MKRVEVDFSTTVRDGMVRASTNRAPDGLLPGERVEAFDSEEGLAFIGVVDRVEGTFAYLRMEWDVSAPVPVNEPGRNFFVNGSTQGAVEALAATSIEDLIEPTFIPTKSARRHVPLPA